MASPRPRYAVYICDKARDIALPRERAYYFIVKFRGKIPERIYLNIAGLPHDFENASCADDLSLTHSREDAFLNPEDVVEYVRSQNYNNATPMTAVHVRFFKIEPHNVPYITPMNNLEEIHDFLRTQHANDMHPKNTNEELYTVQSPTGIIGSQFNFIYTEQGGACTTCGARTKHGAKTQTVAELKALCKKRGLRGYSRMTKAELVKALRRRS